MPPMPPMPPLPRANDATFACPCGTTFSTALYSAVNVTLEPQLLYRLLAGTLNVATCPNCGRKAASALPFIYHDMARGLFAYVHPSADLEDDERDHLLAQLRKVYTLAAQESERLSPPHPSRGADARPRVRRRSPGEDLARIEPEVPPMQVIFGVESLITLVDSLLEPEDRLGKVALSTRSTNPAERARLLRIAGRMADEMECLVDVEDTPEEYTVWVYGARLRTDTLAQALRS